MHIVALLFHPTLRTELLFKDKQKTKKLVAECSRLSVGGCIFYLKFRKQGHANTPAPETHTMYLILL